MNLHLLEHLKSRKLLITLAAMIFILIGWLVSAHWTQLQPQYAVFVNGIVLVVSAFLAGHVVSDIGGRMAGRSTEPPTIKGSPKVETHD